MCLWMFIFGRYRNKDICFLRVGKINCFIKYSLFVDRLLEEWRTNRRQTGFTSWQVGKLISWRVDRLIISWRVDELTSWQEDDWLASRRVDWQLTSRRVNKWDFSGQVKLWICLLVYSLSCPLVTLSTRPLVNSYLCPLFSIKFNIMAALFVHQLPTLSQKIDSREGLFWCKKGAVVHVGKMNIYFKTPPLEPVWGGALAAKWSAFCR